MTKEKLSYLFAIFAISLMLSILPISSVVAQVEESEYAWRDIASYGNSGGEDAVMSSDGSKLLVLRQGSSVEKRLLSTSTDGGATWDAGRFAPDNSRNLKVDASGDKLITRGAWNQKLIHVSTDGGQTWNTRSTTDSNSEISISPDGKVIVESTVNGYLRMSTDDGQTWVEQNAAISRGRLAVLNDGRMILWGEKILSSDDYGKTWIVVNDSISEWRDSNSMAISEDGNSLMYIGYGTGIKKLSTNGGKTWRDITAPSVYYASGSLWISPCSLVVSNDGLKLGMAYCPNSSSPYSSFIYTSTDGGQTWTRNDKRILMPRLFMAHDGSKVFAPRTMELATLRMAQSDSFYLSSIPSNFGVDTAVSNSVITTRSLHCYSINRSSIKTVSPDGIIPSESSVKILGGLTFEVNCSKPAGSSDITVSLNRKFNDFSKVRVYKKSSADAKLEDITRSLTIKNENRDGKEVTTISYRATDGADYDDDKTVNSLITDPIYFGVVE